MALPIYTVPPTKGADIPQAEWRDAPVLADFCSPWVEGADPATVFQALHSPTDFFFRFEVKSSPLYIYRGEGTKFDVLRSERVEIFFRQDPGLKRYFGLEMDPEGRVYDYQSSYYRQSDPSWGWPEGHLSLWPQVHAEGYTLSGRISKASLLALGLLRDGQWLEAGLYRGHCTRLDGSEAVFQWYPWVDPQTEKPDFHVPSSFGRLQLL
ncbi:sugar-binding protein [Phaeodactylibacter luteus]|uniref:Carbohydrate-binding domain-containing protein n=1 Tax=Phaeodactylibacter luteus TaxID=1564516 RepID=A0A5C6S1S2_9BACT|nr:sugar-binding protein [Phaeodactylibacter luteus]TXB67909.1 hypothetical protein FRY97_03420 [Phaeodactylibacter luteus]